MAIKIEGKIVNIELVEYSETDELRIKNAELAAENNTLKKQLMKLRGLAQTVPGQPSGSGT